MCAVVYNLIPESVLRRVSVTDPCEWSRWQESGQVDCDCGDGASSWWWCCSTQQETIHSLVCRPVSSVCLSFLWL